MPNWKKVIVSGSNAVLASVTSSFTGSLTGQLIGTASWATNAVSASYVATLRAAGNDQEIQYNSGSVLSSNSSFKFNYVSQSLILGSSTTATGQYSVAYGQNTQAIGQYSHAKGFLSIASGNYSHAEGYATTAQGQASHAEGISTIAIGTYSHAGGQGTIASGSNQTVIGQYNTQNNTTDLFIIGSGYYDTSAPFPFPLIRRDVLTVGTASMFVSGSVSITGSLNVNGGITGSLFGTSSWATNAISSSKVFITGSAANANYPIVFSDTIGAGTQANGVTTGLNVDSSTLAFNPSSNTLLISNISAGTLSASLGFLGNLTGTSSWAQSASQAITASFLPVGTYNITSSQALTASYTPNAIVTASVSSNVLTFTKGNDTTFNLTVDTGSGGSTSAGGINTNIQINSGSSFFGSNDLIYQWDIAQTNREQLRHRYQYDFVGNLYTNVFNSSYVPLNRANDLGQQAGITHWQTSIAASSGATTIYSFNAGMNVGTTLQMYGFKCDYSIMLNDGTNNAAARVGTLMGAWNNNAAATPALTDTFADGDVDLLELGTVIFTLVWSSNNIELQMDCTNVTSGDTYFNGVFTNFGSTV